MEKWKQDWNNFRAGILTEAVATYKYDTGLVFQVYFKIDKPSYFSFIARDNKALDIMWDLGQDKIAADLEKYIKKKTGMPARYSPNHHPAGLSFIIDSYDLQDHMVKMIR